VILEACSFCIAGGRSVTESVHCTLHPRRWVGTLESQIFAAELTILTVFGFLVWLLL
jgi:hypothetical protein